MSSLTDSLHVEFLESGDRAKLLKEFSYYTDEGVFSVAFDMLEKEHYEKIVIAKPEKMTYLAGWRNRAEAA